MLLRHLGRVSAALSIRRRATGSSSTTTIVARSTAGDKQQPTPPTAGASAAAMATTTTGAAAAAPTMHPQQQQQHKRRVIKGVVFDLDHTMVYSDIDFKEMRRRIGAPPGVDILEFVAALPTERARRDALAAIAEVEHAAIAGMRLAPGALEIARELDERRVPRALVTRNVLRNLHHFHSLHWIPGGGAGGARNGKSGKNENGSGNAAQEEEGEAKKHQQPQADDDDDFNHPFHPAITRECGLRHKPHPDALRHIARQWGVRSEELAMVGDSAFDDVASGRRAGSVTVLIDAKGEYDHEWDASREGRDDVLLEEPEEEQEEQEGGAEAEAVQVAAAAASSQQQQPPLPRRGEAEGGRRGRYLVGERWPHHKVRSLHGVREVLMGEGSRYELVPMPEEAWERRRAEARAAAEAAHAAVAADQKRAAAAAGGGEAATWQTLE